MATQVAEATISQFDADLQRPGRIDRAIGWLEGVPGPTLGWIAVAFACWIRRAPRTC